MNNFLLEYYQKIKDGTIVTSKYILQWYDIVFENLESKEYFFDQKKVEKAIKFVETFCHHHEGRVLARTRNNTLQISTDEHGLKIRADLSKSALGKGLYEDIKNGIIDRMSFGFTIDDYREEESGTDDTTRKILRTITKVGKLYDVSAVSFPANDGTEISARSYIDGVIEGKKLEQAKREEKEAKRKKLILRLKLANMEED